MVLVRHIELQRALITELELREERHKEVVAFQQRIIEMLESKVLMMQERMATMSELTATYSALVANLQGIVDQSKTKTNQPISSQQ